MTVYLFPGQGSQFQGMGDGLFTEFPEITRKASEILGYSLPALCLENHQDLLHQTSYTQPALYTVNALTYLKKKQTEATPKFVAGHSLGEYNALFAAGVFDFETGLRLVKKRGELMQQATGGAMVAILGLKLDDVKTILEQNNFNHIAIANHNSYTQIVISGPKEMVDVTQDKFEQANAKFIPLQVSGAFHSPGMISAQNQFKLFLKNFLFSPPKIPIISNFTAKLYTDVDITKNISEQITHTVRWLETIEYILNEGETDFEEIGVGTILTGIMQRIQNGQ